MVARKLQYNTSFDPGKKDAREAGTAADSWQSRASENQRHRIEHLACRSAICRGASLRQRVDHVPPSLAA